MEKYSFFILSFMLCVNISYGADHRKLTRQESKEVSLKASRIIVNEEHPILEKALERSLIRSPNYSSTDLIKERDQAIDNLSNVKMDDFLQENLKEELMQWAIKELAERNTHEVTQRKGEQKKKWVAAAIGLVSTIITIVVPIIFSEGCNCDSEG